MLNQPLPDIKAWVDFFTHAEMPILKKTARRLEEARATIDSISSRDVSSTVMEDPLIAVRILAHIQSACGRRLHSDITNIAHAVMMMGIEPFFDGIGQPPTIESMLQTEPQAMLGVLQVIRRLQRASKFAYDWAFERHDTNIEEVTLAALLSGLAEVLLWCFAPKLAIEIRDRQLADPSLRSAITQEQVLGIRLIDLQLALCHAWHLPELLIILMDDANAKLPRVQNVTLAVNLARHSAVSWNDAALPDDFKAVEALLHINRDTLLRYLKVPEEMFALYLPASTGSDVSL